ncbi:hypothetical protein BJX64DRAFT_296916 [Aspergillus heterothallicus]
MCLNLSPNTIRRWCGYSKDDIYNAQLWWANLAITVLPGAYYEHSRICIEKHHRQIRRAHAVLQRLKQLTQDNGAEVYIYNLHPDFRARLPTTSSDKPLEETYTDQGQSNDIRRLRTEWRKVLDSLRRSPFLEGTDAVIWKYKNYWRCDMKNGLGRSRLWEKKRQDCVNRGGCCARECGCCERVLHEYPFRDWKNPGRGLEGTVFIRKVYAHCTSECGCCVATHGVYEPDPRLPDPGFVAGGRSEE